MPFTGWVLIPLLIFFVYIKQWMWIKYALFTLPLALSNMVVFSGKNATYNNVYHFLVLAFLYCWAIEIMLILVPSIIKSLKNG
jgi:hypothetical protein